MADVVSNGDDGTHMSPPHSSSESDDEKDGPIKFKVQTLAGQTFDISIRKNASILQLKRQIERADNTFPIRAQKYFVKGRPLKDEKGTIGEIGIGNGGTIYLAKRLRTNAAELLAPPPKKGANNSAANQFPGHQIIRVVCPPNASAGSRVRISLSDGRQLMVQVPNGVGPGMPFQVALRPSASTPSRAPRPPNTFFGFNNTMGSMRRSPNFLREEIDLFSDEFAKNAFPPPKKKKKSARQIFDEAIEKREKLLPESIVSPPVREGSEPLDFDGIDTSKPIKEEKDGGGDRLVYIETIRRCAPRLTWRARRMLQRSIYMFKTKENMESMGRQLVSKHVRHFVTAKQTMDRLRRDLAVESRSRKDTEISTISAFLEACCERNRLLSRFAMCQKGLLPPSDEDEESKKRANWSSSAGGHVDVAVSNKKSTKTTNGSHLRRCVREWATHAKRVSLAEFAESMTRKRADESTRGEKFFFVATGSVRCHDSNGFFICTIPQLAVVSNFAGHHSNLLCRSDAGSFSFSWTTLSPKSFLVCVDRSVFVAPFLEMRPLLPQITTQSALCVLGWASVSAQLQYDTSALVTSEHHLLRQEKSSLSTGNIQRYGGTVGDGDSSKDESSSNATSEIDTFVARPSPDAATAICNALRNNVRTKPWRLTVEECRDMLTRRVGDRAECVTLEDSETLWEEGQDSVDDCVFVVLQGRVDVCVALLPGDLQQRRVLREQKNRLVLSNPMSKKLRLMQKLIQACQVSDKKRASSSPSSSSKGDSCERGRKSTVARLGPTREKVVRLGSFHCGDVICATDFFASPNSARSTTFTARGSHEYGAVLLRLSRSLVASYSHVLKRYDIARFVGYHACLSWGPGPPPPKKLLALADKFVRLTRHAGDTIMALGQPVKNIYWIVDGTMRLTYYKPLGDSIGNEGGSKGADATCELGRGQCFGDMAVDRPIAIASVVVTSPKATLLVLRKYDCPALGKIPWMHLKHAAKTKREWLEACSGARRTSPLTVEASSPTRGRVPPKTDESDPFAVEVLGVLKETSDNLFSRVKSLSSVGLDCDASNHAVGFLKRMVKRNIGEAP
eukprot:g1504.t1